VIGAINPEPPVTPAPPPVIRLRLPRYPVRITYVLLVCLGLVFVGQLALAPSAEDFDPIIAFGAKVNELIAAGEWWRLVTPIFIHGSLLHFAFNAYALFNLGRDIEAVYGPWRYLMLFFYAGVCGTVASMFFSAAPAVGASGAIFGLIGAEAVLLYRNRQLLGERARAGLQNILIIAAINLAIGLSAANIDNWGHLGGLAGGAAMAWVLGPVWVLTSTIPGGEPTAVTDQQSLTAPRLLGAGFLLAGLLGLIALAIVFRR
jgi:rhomboid protease GluP